MHKINFSIRKAFEYFQASGVESWYEFDLSVIFSLSLEPNI